jgi:hypothetical protein
MLLSDIKIMNSQTKETIQILFSIQSFFTKTNHSTKQFEELVKHHTSIALDNLLELRSILNELECSGSDTELNLNLKDISCSNEIKKQ